MLFAFTRMISFRVPPSGCLFGVQKMMKLLSVFSFVSSSFGKNFAHFEDTLPGGLEWCDLLSLLLPDGLFEIVAADVLSLAERFPKFMSGAVALGSEHFLLHGICDGL